MNRREWWTKVVALIAGAIGIKQAPMLKKGSLIRWRAVANGTINAPTLTIPYIDHANRVVTFAIDTQVTTPINCFTTNNGLRGETMPEACQRRQSERGRG